jgi:hypothetical protein
MKPNLSVRDAVMILLFIVGLLVFLFADEFSKSPAGLVEFIISFTQFNKTRIVDALKDIGFLMSIGISTHWISERFFKAEERKEIEKVLAGIIDKDKGVLANGLNQILDVDLMAFVKSLEPGDTVLWNDNFTFGFDSLKDEVIRKAKSGVEFRFLAIAPHCHNVQRREEEVDKDLTQRRTSGRTYYDMCEEYVEIIKDIIEETDITISGATTSGSHKERRVQLRLLRSAPGIPFFMVKRKQKDGKGTLIRALTGFYLTKPSNKFIHLEWLSTSCAHELSFVNELNSFFNAKWDMASPSDLSSPWLGTWDYTCTDLKDKSMINKGSCRIYESEGTIKIEGQRNYSNDEKTRVQWQSVAVYMDSRTERDSNFINFFAYYKLRLNNIDVDYPGFVRWRLVDNKKERSDTMTGEYHLFDDDSTLGSAKETEVGKVVNSRDGTIELKRSLSLN